MAYGEKVLDHYENPRNVGVLDKDAKNVGTGMVGAPACGDVMRLQIQVDDNGVIEEAKFKTYGCGSAIASSSLLTEWVKGKTLDEAAQIKNSDIAEELALPLLKFIVQSWLKMQLKQPLVILNLRRNGNYFDRYCC
ncbi:Iron-sulfur cluster assembly scaffold protein IscU [uncultured Gammaproteobacteria bacterium]|nr:Iron-sulfur cluster assembly scaffold protein IscU [uncultured Gammaproteobacteria bacterium]